MTATKKNTPAQQDYIDRDEHKPETETPAPTAADALTEAQNAAAAAVAEIDAEAAAEVTVSDEADDEPAADYSTLSGADLQSAVNVAITSNDHPAILALSAELDRRKVAEAAMRKLLKASSKAASDSVGSRKNAIIDAINAALAYIKTPTPEALDAFTAAAETTGNGEHPAFRVSVTDYAVRLATAATRTNDSADERDRLNADDLAAANLVAFNVNGAAAAVQIRKTVTQVHPRAYLDAAAPNVCVYERDCPHYSAAVTAGAVTFGIPAEPTKNNAATVTGPAELVEHLTATKTGGDTLTAAQYEAAKAGKLQHGDACSRELVKTGIKDTVNTVTLRDGTTQTMSAFIKSATAPTPKPDATADADESEVTPTA